MKFPKLSKQPPIPLTGKAFFVSDIHFTGDPLDLGTYLASEAVDYLIIIGDLYHLSKTYDEFGIQGTLQLLNLDTYSGQIYFIWGNHDPNVNITTPNFRTLGHFGFFTTPHYTILAYHGTHHSRRGEIALLVNYLISYPLLEQLWRKRVGIPEEIWVFFGHSHIAKLYPDLKIGTCGCFRDFPVLHPSLGAGILVDDYIRLVTIPF